MKTSSYLERKLQQYLDGGYLVLRSENNAYLKVSYRGSGDLLSEKWNIKIYTSGSVVCSDGRVLKDILEDRIKPPDTSKACLQIDDAGIGFPLLGVMVGVTDGQRVETDVVDVSFFQTPHYENQDYIREYADRGFRVLVDRFKADPNIHRIEICTGHINSGLRDLLRNEKYDVRGVSIQGLLQNELEKMFQAYVMKTLGVDLAFDPKELKDKKSIADKYWTAVRWGKSNAPHLLKGWKSLV